MWNVIYELKNDKEETFGPFNSEGLKHERAEAEREKHDPKSHVVDYRVEAVSMHKESSKRK